MSGKNKGIAFKVVSSGQTGNFKIKLRNSIRQITNFILLNADKKKAIAMYKRFKLTSN